MTDVLTEKPPTAVLVRRYLGHLLDVAFHAATVAVPFWLLATRSSVETPSGEPFADTFPVGADRAIRLGDRLFLFDRNELILIAAVSVAVTVLFLVIIQGRLGWTVGKLLTGIRTVNRQGDRPGVFRAFVRTLLLPIDALPGEVLPLVGGLVALFTDTNRRIGDLAAGTYVVRRSATGEDPIGAAGIDTSGWAELDDEPSPVTTLAEGEALRVGGAADPAATETFTTPTTEPTAEGEGEGESAKAPTYQPQWDPARQAYLQWHPGKQEWLEFDDASGEWRPIG